MIKSKKMIMIGSTEKHSGKTTFTEKVIKNLKMKYPDKVFTGVKITILRDGLKSTKGFSITQEHDDKKIKDTARIFKAGANRVFWLRSDEMNIEKGIESLLNELDSESYIICESNSARHYIEPSIFVMIRKTVESEIKQSAKDVLKYNPLEIKSSFENGEISYTPDISDQVVIYRKTLKVG